MDMSIDKVGSKSTNSVTDYYKNMMQRFKQYNARQHILIGDYLNGNYPHAGVQTAAANLDK